MYNFFEVLLACMATMFLTLVTTPILRYFAKKSKHTLLTIMMGKSFIKKHRWQQWEDSPFMRVFS